MSPSTSFLSEYSFEGASPAEELRAGLGDSLVHRPLSEKSAKTNYGNQSICLAVSYYHSENATCLQESIQSSTWSLNCQDSTLASARPRACQRHDRCISRVPLAAAPIRRTIWSTLGLRVMT